MKKLLLLCALYASPALSHEFWLEPLAYSIEEDGNLEASLVNGENFAGSDLIYFEKRIERYEVRLGDMVEAVQMRSGDRPALNVAPLGAGLHSVIYQSAPSTLTYNTWDKFQRFLDHKDLPMTKETHLANGHPEESFVEVYQRFSKTLIEVGETTGTDQPSGMETEFVALTDPYLADTSEFSAQLLYQGEPRANEQVEVFAKSADGAVEVYTTRTDDEGITTIAVEPNVSYMLDAVVLRSPAPEVAERTGAIYETLWANLTFAVSE